MGGIAGVRRRTGSTVLGTLLLAGLLAAPPCRGQTAPPPQSAAQPQSQESPKASAVQPQPVASIPAPQVPARSEDLGRLLQQIVRRLGPDPDLDRIRASLTVRQREIDERSAATTEILQGTPTLFELRDLENYWRGMAQLSLAAKRALSQKAAALQRDLDQLAGQEAAWSATLAQVEAQPGLLSLRDRIQNNIDRIGQVRSKAQDRLGEVLALQDAVGVAELQVADLTDTVGQAMTAYQRELWKPEVKPLWAPRSERLSEVGPSRLAHPALAQDLHNILLYLGNHGLAFAVILLLSLGTLAATVAARRRRPGDPGAPGFSNARWLLSRPVALAVLVAVTGLVCLTPTAPAALISVTAVLGFFPYFRIFVPAAQPLYRNSLRAFAAIFFAYETLGVLAISPVLERELDALWAAGALGFALWLTRPATARAMRGLPFGRRVVAGTRVVAAFFLWSLLANVLGYFDLSAVLSQGTLYSLYLAVILTMVVQLAGHAAEFVLGTATARVSNTVRERGADILRWLRRGLALCGLLVWAGAALAVFTLGARLQRPLHAFLKTPIVVGKAHIAPGDVLLFVLVFAAGVVAAQVVAFLLKEEVLTRMGLRRGLPEAFSTVVRYVLYFAVFLFAFVAAGFPMDKFTLLTGAFGVGIGFGLQNVVNNFVSGLILLFERPINVGDTVDVGDFTGAVSRIGIRSCTVRTFQGAEVIVPNSALVSNSVINWTLSDPRRRVEIPVGVAYGTDPARVMALLVETVRGVPGVLTEPSPVAFFLGFGDSALQFEVRFWAPDQDTHLPLKSQAAVAINDALKAASIEIPFPQRDLRVRSVDPQAARALGGKPDGVG